MIDLVLGEVLEVTDTFVGPKDLSDVTEIVVDTDGACLRHPYGLRLCQTSEYTTCFPCAKHSMLMNAGLGGIRRVSGNDRT